MTIASACSKDLRKSRLPPDTLASEPVTGWRLQTNHSKVAIEWLEWQGQQLGCRLQHARNGGEHPIPLGNRVYHVDGFDTMSHTVYEFYGCFWHGCPKCYPRARLEPHKKFQGRNCEELYWATINRQNLLRRAGYSFVSIWECEWNQQKRTTPGLDDTSRSYDLQAPLNPRDAFFGGRTNAVRLYIDNEPLHYYDFTSLYPFVNKYCDYPIGHPDIQYNTENQNIRDYFGLAV